ncbi:hypothetical protein HC028_11310 [Planosporangium flavigriseum]|uniref:Uncharacterized protein n=1 Tax=Planosporangium flavigriseum TaxID=373681 RepID=A0A8J3PK10_9ACTN|nr:hypothetical protein [Planosporangium flavigriseum]NJC65089.1 hypothetical protein [Planosporangium flavigriseum]GIG71704.1 hypothetical protein Pfl04_01080 [Planosporangium flavigriseum]
MKPIQRVLAVGALVAGLLGSGATAATAQTTPPPPPGASTSASPWSVAQIKHHVDSHLAKVIARATAARQRVNSDSTLTAAQKAKLNADLNKLITDATTARRKVDAANDRAGLEAARPALQAVKADRRQLYKDWEAIHGAHGTATPSAPSTS